MPRNTKEYIFGMLFLKRLSDLFDQEREQLARELRAKGMAKAFQHSFSDLYAKKYACNGLFA